MKKVACILILLCIGGLSAQQEYIPAVRDGFLSIATDARAAGQGDIGVATATDAFSQYWNPSKYVFSDKKAEIGITQILVGRGDFNGLSQLSAIFYNNIDNRSAYALSFRNYAYTINQFLEFGTTQPTHEAALDGSYTLRLSNEFAMSVAGRLISLAGKEPLLNGFTGESSSILYGIDISGYYSGNEIAYKKFNGRWRGGFNFSNLRGESLNDNKDIEIYAPSVLRVGAGFDFIFDQDKVLAITTEYKTLLDSYIENEDREELDFGLEGSVVAVGLEYTYKEKLKARTGYSRGINRLTDSFASIGAGFVARYVNVDISFLLGLSELENLIREKFRISLSLDLNEVF